LAVFCTILSPFVPLLFMGEEHGERAPFLFFSDHIDRKIADATRAGRRREFASFARFDEQIPDPQEFSTFERSKLSNQRDDGLALLCARLLEARRRLAAGGAGAGAVAVAVDFDEGERWLRVRRAEFELVCNFNPDVARSVPCDGAVVELCTAPDGCTVVGGRAQLPPLSGALIR
jgi:maltooligosyltrehalose trehalohydrolase